MDKNLHILRYGTTAEQKFIRKLIDTFDILAINGNMMVHASKSISSFILELCQNSKSKCFGYFIDPITHSFQHRLDMIKNDKGLIKSSIMKLINKYGEPLSKCISSKKCITPMDFNDYQTKESFCKKVIEFQLQTVSENIDSTIKEYISNEELVSNLRPFFVIPPYFYIDNNYEWLSLNIDFTIIAKKLYPEINIFAQIVISQDILENSEYLVNEYKKASLNGVMLWIDSFDEFIISPENLCKYIDLLKNFKKANIRVINLYGSFFSTLLTSNNIPGGKLLSGVGHGLEYGESRPVVPVGGGIPTNKFYFYKAHNRIDYRDMSRYLVNKGYYDIPTNKAAERYYSEICNCTICKEAITNDIRNFRKFENTEFYEFELRGHTQRRSYANQETKELCVCHYQRNKYKEFFKILHEPLAENVKLFKEFYEKESSEFSYDFNAYYLKSWIVALTKSGII